MQFLAAVFLGLCALFFPPDRFEGGHYLVLYLQLLSCLCSQSLLSRPAAPAAPVKGDRS